MIDSCFTLLSSYASMECPSCSTWIIVLCMRVHVLSLDPFLSVSTCVYCYIKYWFSSFFLFLFGTADCCLMHMVCLWRIEKWMADAVSRGLWEEIATIGLAGYVYLCAVKSQRTLRSRRGTGFSSSRGNKEAINQWLRREKESSIMRGVFGGEREPC